jgi:hypothetical protein
MSTTAATPSSAAAAVRAMLRRALRHLLILIAAVTVVGLVVGWFTSGLAGVWGALMGAGIALFFSGTTVLSHLRTADSPPAFTVMLVLGTWLLKMILVVAFFVLVDDLTFYDPLVLVLVLVVGALGSLYLDYLAVEAARVPYVEPDSVKESGDTANRGDTTPDQ